MFILEYFNMMSMCLYWQEEEQQLRFDVYGMPCVCVCIFVFSPKMVYLCTNIGNAIDLERAPNVHTESE